MGSNGRDAFELIHKEFLLYFHIQQLFHYCKKCVIANDFYESSGTNMLFVFVFNNEHCFIVLIV